ncbi:hypothetical protein ACI65C_008986 [Semiaphis heraclei]
MAPLTRQELKVDLSDICRKEMLADQISSSANPCHVDSIDNIAINYYKQIDLAKVNFNNGIFNKDEYQNEIKNAFDNSTSSMKKYDNKPMVLLG